ncbi:MAG: hypothetical protein BWK80_40075 [Desulfobacteraceae bacterium IS3]|nr:MAG: hypothetical protein BWK80_40075 [Desulfobacteraceae bacterium IS3]
MSFCLSVFIFFSLPLSLPAEEGLENNPAGSRPSAVMIERNPWLNVPGSDTPRVALYDDGTLVYLKKYDKEHPFYMVKALDRESLKKLRKSVCLTDNFMKLDRYYRLTDITDITGVDIYMSDGKRSKAVSVYGLRQKTPELPAAWLPYEMQYPDKLPDEFLKVYNAMTDIGYQDAGVWIPAYIEILIWPYEHSPAKPLPWPEKWPSPKDPLTRKHGNLYSLYMDGMKLGDLKILFSKLKQNQTVLIDDRRWSVSYRFVFPCESVWNNAFRKKK